MCRNWMMAGTLAVLLLGAEALAREIHCKQVHPDPYGFSEKFDLVLTEKEELVSILDRVSHGDTTGGFEGNLSARFAQPLRSSELGEPGVLHFAYSKEIPEEEGQPPTRVAVDLRLSGAAERAMVRAVYNDGMGGVDELELDCRE